MTCTAGAVAVALNGVGRCARVFLHARAHMHSRLGMNMIYSRGSMMCIDVEVDPDKHRRIPSARTNKHYAYPNVHIPMHTNTFVRISLYAAIWGPSDGVTSVCGLPVKYGQPSSGRLACDIVGVNDGTRYHMQRVPHRVSMLFGLN